MLKKKETIIRGLKILWSEIPAAFIASSSLFSPIPPRVIIEANRVAIGRASGINVAEPHARNSRITSALSPFPTSSSIYNHRNCSINAKTTMKNVRAKGPRNDVTINLSSFFKSNCFISMLV